MADPNPYRPPEQAPSGWRRLGTRAAGVIVAIVLVGLGVGTWAPLGLELWTASSDGPGGAQGYAAMLDLHLLAGVLGAGGVGWVVLATWVLVPRLGRVEWRGHSMVMGVAALCWICGSLLLTWVVREGGQPFPYREPLSGEQPGTMLLGVALVLCGLRCLGPRDRPGTRPRLAFTFGLTGLVWTGVGAVFITQGVGAVAWTGAVWTMPGHLLLLPLASGYVAELVGGDNLVDTEDVGLVTGMVATLAAVAPVLLGASIVSRAYADPELGSVPLMYGGLAFVVSVLGLVFTRSPHWRSPGRVLAGLSVPPLLLYFFLEHHLATLSVDVHLHDTYFVAGVRHLGVLTLLGLVTPGVILHHAIDIAENDAKAGAEAGRRGIGPGLVVFVGILVACGAMLRLGHEGMPLRYSSYLPRFQPGHRAVTVGGLVYVAGLTWLALSTWPRRAP